MEVLRNYIKLLKQLDIWYFAKSEAKTEQLKDRTASINNNSDKNHIFKMAKRLKRDNVDVVSKCIRNDDGKLTVTVGDKLKAW